MCSENWNFASRYHFRTFQIYIDNVKSYFLRRLAGCSPIDGAFDYSVGTCIGKAGCSYTGQSWAVLDNAELA